MAQDDQLCYGVERHPNDLPTFTQGRDRCCNRLMNVPAKSTEYKNIIFIYFIFNRDVEYLAKSNQRFIYIYRFFNHLTPSNDLISKHLLKW